MSKVIKKGNLAVVTKTYIGSDGQEKSIWKTIGEITSFQNEDGRISSVIELYHMPGVRIAVFEQKPKDKPTPAEQVADKAPAIQEEELTANKEININNLPF